MAHAWNPSIGEGEAGEAGLRVQAQLGLHETLHLKKHKEKEETGSLLHTMQACLEAKREMTQGPREQPASRRDFPAQVTLPLQHSTTVSHLYYGSVQQTLTSLKSWFLSAYLSTGLLREAHIWLQR